LHRNLNNDCSSTSNICQAVRTHQWLPAAICSPACSSAAHSEHPPLPTHPQSAAPAGRRYCFLLPPAPPPRRCARCAPGTGYGMPCSQAANRLCMTGLHQHNFRRAAANIGAWCSASAGWAADGTGWHGWHQLACRQARRRLSVGHEGINTPNNLPAWAPASTGYAARSANPPDSPQLASP
jgi:hypothetical protein